MKLIEEILIANDIDLIKKIEGSKFENFNHLVALSGLDPMVDFRYSNLQCVDFRDADLRGFDFTGADLRGAVKNSNTSIDESTVLKGAKIEWLSRNDADLVQKMLHAESAKTSTGRQDILRSMIQESDSVDHINEYLLRSIRGSRDLEKCLDFADFLVGDVPNRVAVEVAAKVEFLTTLMMKSSARRRSRSFTSRLTAEKIVHRLEKSSSLPLRRIFNALVVLITSEERNGSNDTVSGFGDVSLHDIRTAALRVADGNE